jgi:gamma-glutamylcyclotransferase (GGCT)/AIG2-like uncharacterized protein YtfP
VDIGVDRDVLDACLTLVNQARSTLDDDRAACVALREAMRALTGERAPAALPPAGSRAALEAEVEARLGDPAHSLVTYGTLAPGRENPHVMDGVGGAWSEVTIQGEVGEWEGYPIFRWSATGGDVPAALVRSAALPDHHARLDRFEGPAYVRHLVSYRSSTGLGAANCYVAAPP